MAGKDRVIEVTAGAVEYVTGRVADREGADISAAGFEVGLGTFDEPPVSWDAPAKVEFDGADVALVSMLVGSGTPPVRRGYLWVRVSDAPEVLPRRCDGGTVTVE